VSEMHVLFSLKFMLNARDFFFRFDKYFTNYMHLKL